MNVNQSWPLRNTPLKHNSNTVNINKTYKNEADSFKKALSQSTAIASANSRVDKIEISSASHTQTVSSSFDISKLKEKIMSDISKETSPEKIKEVSSKVNTDSYEASSAEIAKLILKI